jgi:long-chain acyl-CoA synthetase
MTMNDKPWLKSYEPHVPEHLNYPDTPLPCILEHTAQKYAHNRALIFKGAAIRYGELDRLVNRCAAALQRLGLQKGERVALHLPNCPEFVIAYYAVLRAGGIVVPCNPI